MHNKIEKRKHAGDLEERHVCGEVEAVAPGGVLPLGGLPRPALARVHSVEVSAGTLVQPPVQTGVPEVGVVLVVLLYCTVPEVSIVLVVEHGRLPADPGAMEPRVEDLRVANGVGSHQCCHLGIILYY